MDNNGLWQQGYDHHQQQPQQPQQQFYSGHNVNNSYSNLNMNQMPTTIQPNNGSHYISGQQATPQQPQTLRMQQNAGFTNYQHPVSRNTRVPYTNQTYRPQDQCSPNTFQNQPVSNVKNKQGNRNQYPQYSTDNLTGFDTTNVSYAQNRNTSTTVAFNPPDIRQEYNQSSLADVPIKEEPEYDDEFLDFDDEHLNIKQEPSLDTDDMNYTAEQFIEAADPVKPAPARRPGQQMQQNIPSMPYFDTSTGQPMSQHQTPLNPSFQSRMRFPNQQQMIGMQQYNIGAYAGQQSHPRMQLPTVQQAVPDSTTKPKKPRAPRKKKIDEKKSQQMNPNYDIMGMMSEQNEWNFDQSLDMNFGENQYGSFSEALADMPPIPKPPPKRKRTPKPKKKPTAAATMTSMAQQGWDPQYQNFGFNNTGQLDTVPLNSPAMGQSMNNSQYPSMTPTMTQSQIRTQLPNQPSAQNPPTQVQNTFSPNMQQQGQFQRNRNFPAQQNRNQNFQTQPASSYHQQNLQTQTYMPLQQNQQSNQQSTQQQMQQIQTSLSNPVMKSSSSKDVAQQQLLKQKEAQIAKNQLSQLSKIKTEPTDAMIKQEPGTEDTNQLVNIKQETIVKEEPREPEEDAPSIKQEPMDTDFADTKSHSQVSLPHTPTTRVSLPHNPQYSQATTGLNQPISFPSETKQLQGQQSQFQGQHTQFHGQQTPLQGQQTQFQGQQTQFQGQQTRFQGQQTQFQGQRNQLQGNQGQFQQNHGQRPAINQPLGTVQNRPRFPNQQGQRMQNPNLYQQHVQRGVSPAIQRPVYQPTNLRASAPRPRAMSQQQVYSQNSVTQTGMQQNTFSQIRGQTPQQMGTHRPVSQTAQQNALQMGLPRPGPISPNQTRVRSPVYSNITQQQNFNMGAPRQNFQGVHQPLQGAPGVQCDIPGQVPRIRSPRAQGPGQLSPRGRGRGRGVRMPGPRLPLQNPQFNVRFQSPAQNFPLQQRLPNPLAMPSKPSALDDDDDFKHLSSGDQKPQSSQGKPASAANSSNPFESAFLSFIKGDKQEKLSEMTAGTAPGVKLHTTTPPNDNSPTGIIPTGMTDKRPPQHPLDNRQQPLDGNPIITKKMPKTPSKKTSKDKPLKLPRPKKITKKDKEPIGKQLLEESYMNETEALLDQGIDPMIEALPQRVTSARKAKENLAIRATYKRKAWVDSSSSGEERDYDSDKDPVWDPFAESFAPGGGSDSDGGKKRRRGQEKIPRAPRTKKKRSAPTRRKKNEDIEFTFVDSLGETHGCELGDFIVQTNKLADETFPIWKLDSGALIQKFEALECDNGLCHQATTTYSKWTNDNKHEYQGLQVQVLEEDDEGATLVQIVTVEDDDDESDVVDSETKQEEDFFVVMQTLLSQALEPGFIETVIDEEVNYYLEPLDKFDRLIQTKKAALLTDIKWSENFVRSVESRPYINVVERSESEKCQARIDQREIAVKCVELYGQMYDPISLEPVDNDQDLPDSDDYMVGPTTAEKVVLYHKLEHFKFSTYKRCSAKIEVLKEDDESLQTKEILDKCISNRSWVLKIYEEFKKL